MEVDKILKSQPWSFDKHLILMQRYSGDVPITKLVFEKVPFWLQVHDLPISFMTREMVENLCEVVGEIQKTDGAMDEDGGSFFRVRMVVDITLPLCRGRVITLPNGNKSWVQFKYERLPSICYWCGHLDHDNKDCNLWIQSNGTLTSEQQQFSPNLRAPPYRSTSRDVIYVPSYYEERKRSIQARKQAEMVALEKSRNVSVFVPMGWSNSDMDMGGGWAKRVR